MCLKWTKRKEVYDKNDRKNGKKIERYGKRKKQKRSKDETVVYVDLRKLRRWKKRKKKWTSDDKKMWERNEKKKWKNKNRKKKKRKR